MLNGFKIKYLFGEKMRLIALLLCLSVTLFTACSQNSKKSGAPVNRSSVQAADTKPSDVYISEDILSRYKGVSFEITEYETGKKTVADVAFDETFQTGGLTITVLQFFPDFKINDKNSYFTESLEPNNVAARVNVVSADHEFSGWLFASYPEVHPFTDPKYNVTLLKAIEK
jgi:hypothetical protein